MYVKSRSDYHKLNNYNPQMHHRDYRGGPPERENYNEAEEVCNDASCNTCFGCTWGCKAGTDFMSGNCYTCGAPGSWPSGPGECLGKWGSCGALGACCCPGFWCNNTSCEETTAPFAEGGRPCTDYPPPCSMCIAATGVRAKTGNDCGYARTEEDCAACNAGHSRGCAATPGGCWKKCESNAANCAEWMN